MVLHFATDRTVALDHMAVAVAVDLVKTGREVVVDLGEGEMGVGCRAEVDFDFGSDFADLVPAATIASQRAVTSCQSRCRQGISTISFRRDVGTAVDEQRVYDVQFDILIFQVSFLTWRRDQILYYEA